MPAAKRDTIMDKYITKQGNENDLDLIRPLWEKLNQLHFNLALHFKSRFQDMTWEKRKQNLLKKSKDMLVDYVVYSKKGYRPDHWGHNGYS